MSETADIEDGLEWVNIDGRTVFRGRMPPPLEDKVCLQRQLRKALALHHEGRQLGTLGSAMTGLCRKY